MARKKLQLTDSATTEKTEGSSQPSEHTSLVAVLSRSDLIPTGSTLLNLSLADDPYGGYGMGTIVNLVGDRDTGKTFLALNMFAEVVRDRRFDKYALEYRDIEGKMQIPLVKLFAENGTE